MDQMLDLLCTQLWVSTSPSPLWKWTQDPNIKTHVAVMHDQCQSLKDGKRHPLVP